MESGKCKSESITKLEIGPEAEDVLEISGGGCGDSSLLKRGF